MRILLISPQSHKEAAERSFMAPALGVIRLAGYLNANGHKADTHDPNLHMLTGVGKTLQEKLEECAWDYIGFSVLEETILNDIQNMYLARKLRPDATIIAGGIEAQFNYQTLLDKSPCRYVILSEGEVALLQLVNGVPPHTIPGIVFKNPSRPMDQELFNETTSLIDWESTNYEAYWDYYLKKYGDKATPENLQEIHTVRVFSRNRCPIGCRFCSSTNQITWGAEAAVPVISATEDTLIETVARVRAAHPRVRTIYLTDDDFCINKRSVIRFCQKVVERGFGDLSFMCFARASDLSEEVCHWMKKANFRRLNIGIESFSEAVLEEMGKRCTAEENLEALARLKRHGIKAYTNLIMITPKTKLEDIETTIEKALPYVEDGYHHAGVTLAIKPLKGTEFHETNWNFLSVVEPVEGTRHSIRRDDMILADDPLVRRVQLDYWQGIDDHIARVSLPHYTNSMLAAIKLRFMLSLVQKVRGEAGAVQGDENLVQFPSVMPYNERQTVDLPESVASIAHPSSSGQPPSSGRRKSAHGGF